MVKHTLTILWTLDLMDQDKLFALSDIDFEVIKTWFGTVTRKAPWNTETYMWSPF